MNAAEQTMRRLNPHSLVAREEDRMVFLEDVTDPDGRMYRLEYQSTPDGRHASAWCRWNPWSGDHGRPHAGLAYHVCHCSPAGMLCLGNGATPEVEDSPFTLELAVARARYWCTAFSVLKETGRFPNL